MAQMGTNKYLRSIDATKWGAFGGADKIPFILGVTTRLGTQGSGGIVCLGTPTLTGICAYAYLSNATTVSLTRYGQGGGVQTSFPTTTVAAGAWITRVWASDGAYAYTIDGTGVRRTGDLVGDTTGVDRLIVNAQWDSTGTSDISVRRLYIKTPSTTDALGEAIELYTALSALY